MIRLHYYPSTAAMAPHILLEELGVPYDMRRYQRDPRTKLAPASLKAVHPLGKSPVITDGDLTLAESGAILEYLVERHGHGRFKPATHTPEWVRYTYWMHFAEGTAMPPLLMKLVFDTIERKAPLLVRPIAAGIASKARAMIVTPNLQRHLQYMESELAERDWFAGDAFTVADVQMSFPLEASAARGGLDARYPRLTDFLARIHARPAYKRALAKGGPLTLG